MERSVLVRHVANDSKGKCPAAYSPFVRSLDVGHRCEAVKELSNLRGRSKRGRLGLSITSDPHHVRQT